MYTKTLHEPVAAIVHISVLKILSITQIFTQYEYVGQREGIGRPRVTVQHLCHFLVLWQKPSAPEEKLLPVQLFSSALRDLHQPARGVQPLQSSPWRIPHYPLHL